MFMTPIWEERFFRKVEFGDCWHWMASVKGAGYGQFVIGRKNYSAHRLAWMHLVGPIPVGLELDHLCKNRRCVNPDHLEPVTGAENSRRAAHPTKPACAQGHPFTAENSYVYPSGRRSCRACRQAWVRAKDARRLAA